MPGQISPGKKSDVVKVYMDIYSAICYNILKQS